LKVRAHPVLKYFSVTPPENSGGAENSTENSGPYAKNFYDYHLSFLSGCGMFCIASSKKMAFTLLLVVILHTFVRN
jgi:hypothetical protein